MEGTVKSKELIQGSQSKVQGSEWSVQCCLELWFQPPSLEAGTNPMQWKEPDQRHKSGSQAEPDSKEICLGSAWWEENSILGYSCELVTRNHTFCAQNFKNPLENLRRHWGIEHGSPDWGLLCHLRREGTPLKACHSQNSAQEVPQRFKERR